MNRRARIATVASQLLIAGCTVYQDPPAQYPPQQQAQPPQEQQPQQPPPPQQQPPVADPQYTPQPQYAPPPPPPPPPQPQYTPPPAPPPSAFRGSPPPPPPPPPAAAGAQSIVVPADRPEAVWSAPLAAGVTYTIEASGAFSVWGDEWDGVDAYYGYSARHVGPQPQLWSQLLIDDRAMLDLARDNRDPIQFNPSHLYATSIQGTGRALKLQILDARNGSWRDNHRGVTVRLIPRGPAAPYAVAPPSPTPPTPAAPPTPAGPPSAWRGTPPPPPPGAYVTGETVIVHAHRPEPVWTSAPLAPGAVYLVEVSGVFSMWQEDRDGVDALYEYSPRRVGPQPQLRPQLLVDDRSLFDLARESGAPVGFNPGHVYTATIRGTGQRAKLQIADARNGSWGDNHGALQVRITRR
jgi:hypothetical protein